MPGSVHKDEYRSIIDRLVAVRTGAGVTQVQLAERLGKPQSYVSKIERGERRLDVLEFCQIARGLDRDPADLLSDIVR